MAVVETELTPVGSAIAAEWLQAMIRFLGSVWQIESIERVAFSKDSEHLDIWILLQREVLPDLERISASEREFRQAAGPAPVDVHVHALDKIDVSSLPEATTVFERRPLAAPR